MFIPQDLLISLRISNVILDYKLHNEQLGLKSLKGPLSGLSQFLATKSPLKTMKNTFYLNVKSSVRSCDVYNFVLTFHHVGKRLVKKAKANFNIMTSHTRELTIAIHILSKISRSKSNQAMKLS